MDRAVAINNSNNINRSSFIGSAFNFIKNYIFPFLVAALILLTSGHARTTTRQGDFNKITLIALFIFALIFIVLFFIKTPTKVYKSFLHPIKEKLYKNPLIYTVIIPIIALAIFALYYWKHANTLTTVGHYLLLIAFSFCFALSVPFKTFIKYFNKTLSFLAILSLIMFFMTLQAGRMPFYTSTFNSVNEACYRSFLDLYFRIDVGNPRNYGPFWEPGIFSLVLIIGIVFELLGKDRPNWINVLIYSATIFTTLSTSGMILLTFCLPLYFGKKKHRYPFYISLVISAALVWFFIYLGDPTHKVPFFSEVFSKLFNNSSQAGSFKTRLDSPIYGGVLFLESKGLGFGPNLFDALYLELKLNGETTSIAQTSTFGWLIGSFGILGCYFIIVFIIALFWYFFKRYNLRTALLVVAFTLVVTNCEPMYAFSFFWVIAMYPISYLIKRSYEKRGFNETLDESVSKSNVGTKLTFNNLSGSLVIKVLTLFIGLFTYPLYIKYFANQTSIMGLNNIETTHGSIALGAWLVILQILSWVLTFDMGIGNGLKNKIVAALNENRREDVKKYISCSYVVNFVIIFFVLVVGTKIIDYINFNDILKISEEVIPLKTLQLSFKLAFISICLEFFLKIVLNIYQALQKETVASAIPLVSTVLLLIFVSITKIENMGDALVAISTFYIFSINIPLLILTIICFLTVLKDCRPSFNKWSFKVAKSIITLGGLYFLIQIFLLVINSTNRVIISNNYGASVVTEYEPYLKIFSALTMVGSAISMPLWTLTVRADVRHDYMWIKKTKKMAIYIIILFTIGAALVATFLQLIFNLWLGESTIKVDYLKAGLFALWSVVTVASYFASAFSNGLQILKPQLIIYGVGSIIKIPLFILMKRIVPSLDWISLIIIDSFIMLIASLTMLILNDLAIKKRIKKYGQMMEEGV